MQENAAMKKGALALLVHGGTDNWSPARWKSRFDDVCPDRPVLQPADAAFDPALVRKIHALLGRLAEGKQP